MLTKAIWIVLGTFALNGSIDAQTTQPVTRAAAHARPNLTAKYGSNPAAGRTFTHDGVRLYYEDYGTGEALLLVHGNGSSIGELKAQIDYFRKRYRVIVIDSRDHGKSDDSLDDISYEKMTEDLAALLDHLQIGSAYVLGWSDGGIEALLLGIRHPAKVKKIAAMAANLNPSEHAIYPEVIALAKSMMDSVPAAERGTPAGKRALKVTQMLLASLTLNPRRWKRSPRPHLCSRAITI
jgi:pimeloyl-ACP methyl ester carboxylesterase